MNEYVTLKELSKELSMDRSHLRKYVLARGISPAKIRTPESGGQLTLAITQEESEMIREFREAEGFTHSIPAINGDGYFYVILLVPDLDPGRVKVGFASDANARLDAHRTSAPTAELFTVWPCKRCWEKSAIDCATKEGCELIRGEVFACNDVRALVARCDAFFQVMPAL